jgi:hypothetical protein
MVPTSRKTARIVLFSLLQQQRSRCCVPRLLASVQPFASSEFVGIDYTNADGICIATMPLSVRTIVSLTKGTNDDTSHSRESEVCVDRRDISPQKHGDAVAGTGQSQSRAKRIPVPQ